VPIFIIHKHQATRLHWDLRLEMDGVLKSWAVPKEPPKKAGIKRLAFQVEDHDLDYAEFEGEIPEDEYGAGTVEIWDKGEYDLLESHENRFKFKLLGKKLKGIYVLFKFPKAGANAWLFFKTKVKP
jgi:DNA ligase D-like protein (predicted 3'-phosphoesterase)